MICELLARSDDAHDLVRYVPTIGIRSCPSKYHSVDSALLRNLHDMFAFAIIEVRRGSRAFALLKRCGRGGRSISDRRCTGHEVFLDYQATGVPRRGASEACELSESFLVNLVVR